MHYFASGESGGEIELCAGEDFGIAAEAGHGMIMLVRRHPGAAVFEDDNFVIPVMRIARA